MALERSSKNLSGMILIRSIYNEPVVVLSFANLYCTTGPWTLIGSTYMFIDLDVYLDLRSS